MIKEAKLNITLSADTRATITKITEVVAAVENGNNSYYAVDFVIKSDAGTLGSTFIVTVEELLNGDDMVLKEGMEVMISPNGDVQQAISPSKPTNARTPTSKSTNLD